MIQRWKRNGPGTICRSTAGVCSGIPSILVGDTKQRSSIQCVVLVICGLIVVMQARFQWLMVMIGSLQDDPKTEDDLVQSAADQSTARVCSGQLKSAE